MSLWWEALTSGLCRLENQRFEHGLYPLLFIHIILYQYSEHSLYLSSMYRSYLHRPMAQGDKQNKAKYGVTLLNRNRILKYILHTTVIKQNAFHLYKMIVKYINHYLIIKGKNNQNVPVLLCSTVVIVSDLVWEV